MALLASLLLSGALAWAEASDDPEAIEAAAEVPVMQRNVAQARQEALQKALISVNLLQAQKLVPAPVWLGNQDIVGSRLSGDPHPYIQDFRVLREQTAGGLLRVEIRAVPRAERLREDLLKWGILYDRARRPRITVEMLEERRPSGASKGALSPVWTHRLIKRLQGLGFSVSAANLAASDGGDLVVKGSVSPYGDRSISVHLTASRVNPPLELSRISGNYPLEPGPDVVGGLVASALLENLLPAWFRASGEGREFSVGLTGLKSYKQYQELSEVFNSGRDGFASGVERMYAPGFVSFGVVFGGSMAELVPALGRIRLTGGRIRVMEVAGQTVSAAIQ